MLNVDWKAIIAYVLPRYKATVNTLAYQTNAIIQAKLEERKKKKETTWGLVMVDELLES